MTPLELQKPDAQGAGLYAITSSHPFSGPRHRIAIPEGVNLEIIAHSIIPGVPLEELSFFIFLDGEMIARERWADITPHEGQEIHIRVLPSGDAGRMFLRTILTIAVVGVSFWSGGLAAGFVGKLLGAGLLTGGMYAVNKLVPIPTIDAPDYPADPPTYEFTGTSNQIGLDRPIPRIYGKIKTYPPLGARPYTETIGSDVFARLLFIPGYGPLDLDDFQIDGLDLANLDAEVEVRQGYDDDEPLELYSDTVIEDQVNAELLYNNWIYKTTRDDTDEITLDINFPYGLTLFSNEGYRVRVSVDMEINYRQYDQQYFLYDGGTEIFVEGDTITGGTSNATADILEVSGDATSGYLRLWKVTGIFQNNETITGASQGSADVAGTIGDSYVVYNNRAGGSFAVGNTITGGTSGAIGTLRGYTEVAALGEMVIDGTNDYYEDNEQLSNGLGQTADVSGDPERRGPWLPNPTSTVENLCPDFDDWTAGGGAQIVANNVLFDNYGEYVESPYIKINHAPDFDFTAEYSSAATAPEYTPESGRYLTISYYKRGWPAQHAPVENDDGESETKDGEGFTVGGFQSDKFDGTGGQDVEWIKIRIEAIDPFTPTTYQIKNPEVITTYNTTIWGRTTRYKRWTVRIIAPYNGKYELRVRRTTEDRGAGYYDDSYWGVLRSIEWVDPVGISGLAKIAMRIKMNSYVSGMIDRFSCVATSILPAWNGAAWDTAAATQNPAWALCDILKGNATSIPVTDSKLDLTAIKSWADSCTTKGMNIGGIIDNRTIALQACSAVTAAGRASFANQDGIYTVLPEHTAPTSIKQHLTPRTSWGFEGTKTFHEAPHCVKVQFKNEDEDYEWDERFVYDDDYDEDNATIFETIKLWGVTNDDRAWKEGRYHLAVLKLRPEIYTLNADVESVVCQRGDLVRVTHDVPMWGHSVGRITATNEPGGGILEVTLDETVTMEGGGTYGMRIRISDGSSVSLYVQTDAGDQTTVSLLLGVGNSIAIGNLFQFGTYGSESQECLVHSITAGQDLVATLTLVDLSSGIYTADSGTIPDHDSNISKPPEIYRRPPTPNVISTRSDESVLYRSTDGSLEAQILIEFGPVSTEDITPAYLQADYREYNAGAPWTRLPEIAFTCRELEVRPVNEGDVYDIRIRHVTEFGKTSGWVEINEHTVIGKSSAPADVSTLYINPPSQLIWAYPDAPPDLAGFRVRFNDGTDTSWTSAQSVHDGLISVTTYDIGTFTGGTSTWMVKAVDTSGNESTNAAVLYWNLGDPASGNLITDNDYHDAGFPGELENCTVDAGTGDLEADEETALFWGDDDEGFWTSRGADSDLFWGSYFLQAVYTFPFFPDPTDTDVDCWLEYTVVSMRDLVYRRDYILRKETFTNLDDWTGNGGAWAIVGNACEGVGDGGADYNKWDYDITLGTKTYIAVEVDEQAHAGTTSYGLRICGRVIRWHDTGGGEEWQMDTGAGIVQAGRQPARSSHWLIEILADETINFYSGGEFVDSTTPLIVANDIEFYINGNLVKVQYDDVRMWEPAGDWLAWPGKITTAADELYEWRWRPHAGSVQGMITALTINVDVEDIIEYVNDESIAAAGVNHLTITKTYREVTNVRLTLQDDAGTATYAMVMDKNPGGGNGPEVETYDKTGARVAGTVDAEIIGY